MSPEQFVTDEMGNMVPGWAVAQAADAAKTQDVGYFTRKINEFQGMLYDLDTTEANLRSFIQDYNIEDESLLQSLDELDDRKMIFRTTAEALNLAVAGINAVGGSLPSVRIPGGLAALPAAALAGAAAAVAGAAALIVWGREWIIGVNDRLKTEAILKQIPENQRGQAAARVLELEQTRKNAEESPLGNIANIVKWAAIAAGLYFAFQALSKSR